LMWIKLSVALLWVALHSPPAQVPVGRNSRLALG
jgi:hypothetical protein